MHESLKPLKPMKYRPEIDGLRAIAVLSVLIFHAFPQVMPGGFIGVDIFFVISGYLISKILFTSLENNQFSYRDFYKRRIVRIFPALLLMFFLVLSLGWLSLFASEFILLGKHIFSSTVFMQNINLLKESGYFDLSADYKPLLHLWSLSIEEQFYIFWPPLLFMIFKKKKSLGTWIFTLTTLSFLICINRVRHYPDSAFYETHFRSWELFSGAFLAYVHTFTNENNIFTRAYQKLTAFVDAEMRSRLGLFLIFISLLLINSQTLFPSAWTLLPVLGSFLIISSESDGTINRHFLSHKWMVFVGLISYPLYLFHWPLLSFVHILSPFVSLGGFTAYLSKFLCLVLAFILSLLTYYCIEKPTREFAKKNIFILVPINYAVVILVVLFVSVGGVGYSLKNSDGFINRQANQNLDPRFNVVDHGHLIGCVDRFKLPGIEGCATNNPSEQNADVVIIGDSHSMSMASAFAQYYEAKGRFITVFEVGDTLGLWQTAVDVAGPPSIDGIRSLNSAFIFAKERHAKTVILVSRGPIYIEHSGFGIDNHLVTTIDMQDRQLKDFVSIYKNGLERSLQFINDIHAEAIFVYDNPELGFYPKQMCLKRPFSLMQLDPMNPCAVEVSQVISRQVNYRKIVAEVLQNFPQTKTFDPQKALCDSKYCYAIKDGQLLYNDHNHLNYDGALSLIKYFDF